MEWFKRHWRKLAILAATIAAGATGGHTLYQRSGAAQMVPQILQQIPCTPGEAGCAEVAK